MQLIDTYPCSLCGDAGSFIDKNTLSYLNSGCNGHVWQLENEKGKFAVKTFINREFCLDYTLYEKMANLELQQILKAIEAFKHLDSAFDMDAYMMHYLEKDSEFSMLDYPVSLLLDNFSTLSKDAKMLADNHIVMCDVGVVNSIFDVLTSKLYVSDIDYFYYDESVSSFRILDRHYELLLDLFVSYMRKGLEESDFLSFDKNNYITQLNQLFMDDYRFNKPCDKIEQVFGKYETPRQYFVKK